MRRMLALMVVAAAMPVVADVHYVATNGLHHAPYTNWTDAATNVQAAIDAAVSGDSVWVAAGTYKPTSEYGGTGDRYRSFQLKTGVAVYGGFDGTEDPGSFELDSRDFAANETILSGDLGVEGTVGDNAYHVVVGTNDARLDGFTVTMGNANGSSWAGVGGGIHNNH